MVLYWDTPLACGFISIYYAIPLACLVVSEGSVRVDSLGFSAGRWRVEWLEQLVRVF